MVYFLWYEGLCLVGVSKTTHSAHHTQHIVVGSVDTHLSRVGARNGRIGQDQLESGVVNAREVAGTRGLVLFGAEGKRVDIDTLIRGTGVVLEGLN